MQTTGWTTRTSLSVTPGSRAVRWFASVGHTTVSCLFMDTTGATVCALYQNIWIDLVLQCQNHPVPTQVTSMYSELKFYTSWKRISFEVLCLQLKSYQKGGYQPTPGRTAVLQSYIPSAAELPFSLTFRPFQPPNTAEYTILEMGYFWPCKAVSVMLNYWKHFD